MVTRSVKSGLVAGASLSVLAASMLIGSETVWAQTPPGSTVLPPASVDAPKQRPAARAKSRSTTPRTAAARQRTTPAPAPATAATPQQASVRPGFAPVAGYVATQSTTGTKTDTPILENPQSVSVVGREQMEQQGPTTVAESLRYTAGVLAGSRPGNRFDDVFIRGFGGFGFTAGYVQFLDGLKMQRGVSYAIPSVDPYGLERVEVIKGPASVLYGQTNPGGLVNMVSKRPTDKTFREIEFQFGNYERMQAAFDMGGALDKDGQLLYRITGLGLNSATSVDYTDQQRIYFAPAFTWRPTVDTTITFLNHYQYDPKSFQPNYLPAQGLMPGVPGVPSNKYGRLPTSFYIGDPQHDSYKREWMSSGYELEHRASDIWTLRQNLRLTHLTSEFYAIPANPGYASTLDPIAIQRAKTSVDENFNGAVVDNQAQAKFNTGWVNHTMLFGIDYQYTDANRLLGQARNVPAGNVPNLNVLNPIYYQNIQRAPFQTDQNVKSSQLGVYVQDQMKLDRLTVSLAGRQDRSEIKFNTLTLSNFSNIEVNQNDNAFTYRAGAIYNFDFGLAPYVNYATSFEPAPYLAAGNKPLAPMTGRQYEFGLKYQPMGLDALFTVAYFDITQQNVINGDPANAGFYVQTGEVSSRGFEFEAKASLSKSLNVIGSVTLLDAKVTADKLPVNVGKRPFAVPNQMASGWADYTFRYGALAGFGTGAGVRYIGDSAGDPANTFFVRPVTLADAAVHYDFGYLSPQLKGVTARVNVNNLLDKIYVASCFTLANGCFWGARRTVVGTVKYSF